MEETSMSVAPMMGGLFSVQFVLDIVAVIIGLVAIYYLFRLNRRLGGKLSVAIHFFNLGMASNVLAIVWSTFWGHEVVLVGYPVDVHHVLMSIGMIFFVISTQKFTALIPSSSGYSM